MRCASVFAAALTFAGAGCGGKIKTVTLSPSAIASNYVVDYWSNFGCNFSEGGQGGLQIGPDYSAGPGQFIVGLQDIDQVGQGPAACEEILDYNFRGAVAFDVSLFRKMIGATLKVDVEGSVSADGEVVSQNPPACNATILADATGTDGYNFDPTSTIPLPPCGRPYSIGVT